MSEEVLYATPDELALARAELRQRWYDDGYYGHGTMSDFMRQGAERHPDVELIFHSEQRPDRATLGEMWERANLVAGNLQALGLQRGDVVAIQTPSWLEGVLMFEAAMLCGAIVVPVIHIYGPAEVGFILRQSKAKVLVVPDRWGKIDFIERLAALEDVPDLEQTIVIGDRIPPGALAWDDLAVDRGNAFVPPALEEDDVCLLVYTSGTTADPKGVQHTHNTLGHECRTRLFDTLETTGMGMFPFGHIAGALTIGRMFIHGIKMILVDRWEPHAAAALVEEHGVESSAGTPYHLQTLIDAAEADGRDITSLRRMGTGAAAVPPTLIERYDALGIRVVRQYGSSEHPVVTSSSESDSLVHRSQTDGHPSNGNEIRIVDDDGNDVPAGDDGEVALRGPEQFIGYRDPALDATSYLPGAWFLSGDVGNLDPDGYLTITDRKKDVIIRGGENIASKEVEDVLSRHPDVVEVAVVAMPDERMGEVVCAFAILRPGSALDLSALVDHFRAAGVAKQKTPERLVVVDELPRTPSGKVKKFELRQQLRQEAKAARAGR
ncbi:MAG: AMP-binding protein [Ilumatobacteraceae bacterium]